MLVSLSMKHLLCLLLSLQFVMPAYASTSTDELELAYQDLTYSLQVEWDQTSDEAYQDIANQFAHKIAGMKERGLTNDELISFSVSHLKDKKTAEETRKMLSLVSAEKLSSEEAFSMAESILSNGHAEGANWSGRTTALAVGSVVVVLVVLNFVAGNPIGGIIVGEHPHGHGR